VWPRRYRRRRGCAPRRRRDKRAAGGYKVQFRRGRAGAGTRRGEREIRIMKLTCRRMTARDALAAEALLAAFLREDEHYLSTAAVYGDKGPRALKRALRMFLARPRLGFVWLAFADGRPAGVCVVSYAISTSIGGLVAKLDDVSVAQGFRGRGVGAAMLRALEKQLRKEKVKRIDTAVVMENDGAARFYARLGYKAIGEERLAKVV
jgi:GNAT superfamily N-acetyltransferase